MTNSSNNIRNIKMRHRSPIAVFFLALVTFGIYGLFWEIRTKNEMNRLGANIPTAWLLIVPFVNIWWMWKYCEGVEKVTGGKLSGIMAFVLFYLLSVIGMAIIQNEFNQVGQAAAATPLPGDATAPVAPITPAAPATAGAPAPDNSFGGPVTVSPTPTVTAPVTPAAGPVTNPTPAGAVDPTQPPKV
jgi:hypothetical protein